MYATANDMRDRYKEAPLVQLTDSDSWDNGCIAKIEVELRAASVLVDGYVAKYYQAAPGQAVPPLLVELTCQIAYCELAANPTEYAIKRKSEALAHLRDISRGLLKLDEGTPDAIPSREGQIIVPDAERVFSHDKLKGF